MKQAKFVTPVVTAFDADGGLDMAANRAIWEHLIAGGMDGILFMGSSGEFFALTNEQKHQIIDAACAVCKGRTKVYIGTCCLRADETIELSNDALSAGADAVFVITPYYFALSDASIEAWYDAVVPNIKGPVFLYNYPDRTVHDLSAEITLRLLRKYPNIVGYKDSVADFGHTRKVLTTVLPEFPDFEMYAGFDENLIHCVYAGGTGCIGGLSNLAPEVFSAWCRAINAGDTEQMAAQQQKADRLMELYSVGQPFMPAMKTAMALRGLPVAPYHTTPFLSPDENGVVRIKTIMQENGLLSSQNGRNDR